MITILPFFLLFVAIIALFKGVNHLFNTNKVAMKKKQKKEKKVKKEVSLSKMKFNLRIEGVISLFFALLILLTIKFNIGIHNSPELTLHQGDANATKAYEKAIHNFIDSNQIPGLIVGIVNGDEKILYSFGYDSINKAEAVDENTLFEIGSISKVFTGLLLADAVDSERISLDDTVKTYIGSDKIGEDSVFNNIKMRHLTTHTSGLPGLPQNSGYPLNVLYSAYTGSNPYKIATKENMYKYMKRTKKLNGLGENWKYSNYGVGVLGMCLSNIHQKSYNEMLEDVILEPLEMTNTSVLYNGDKNTYAASYRSYIRLGSLSIGIRSAPWLMKEGIVACGGIRSNGKDMLLFLDALVNESLPFMSTSKEPLFRINEQRQIGMNWIIDYNEEQNKSIIWHNGETGGFKSYVGFFEDTKTGVFTVTNSKVSTKELTDELLALLID